VKRNRTEKPTRRNLAGLEEAYKKKSSGNQICIRGIGTRESKAKEEKGCKGQEVRDLK